ncbi:MAG: flagellar biosynthetic protein FliR [Rhizomicrobium sp.]
MLALQIAFGALYVAGRTLDIQAGYGLAVLIDPGTQSQVPLIGTLFVYAAAVVFFGVDGHIALLRMLAASLDAIPLGGWTMPHSIERLTAFIGMTFLTAFGVAGGSILAMFLIDMAIALLSRTVPQMNVLVLGFQVENDCASSDATSGIWHRRRSVSAPDVDGAASHTAADVVTWRTRVRTSRNSRQRTSWKNREKRASSHAERI